MATKVALITGASSGIGEATAVKLIGLAIRLCRRAAVDRMRHLTKSSIKPFAWDVFDGASV